MVSNMLSYSNFVSKMHRFGDVLTYWSKIAEKPTPLSFDAPVKRTPANICINLILLETAIFDVHFAADTVGLSSFTFLRWAPKDICVM